MGTLKVITAPTSEPVTLSEVKDALRVDHSDDDAKINKILKSSREFAERYCGIRIMTTVIELSMDRWAAGEFSLGVWPLQSIDSVKYDDTASPVAEQTLTVNTDYYADTTLIEGRVRTITGWPSVAVKPQAIRIRMTAGYASRALVPEAIKEGIKAYAVFLYENCPEMAKSARDILWQERIL